MRALNPLRPQLPTTSYLFPRSFVCIFLLSFVLRGGETRSVPRDEDGPVQPTAKLLAIGSKSEVVLASSEKSDGNGEQEQGKLLASQDRVDEDGTPVGEQISRSTIAGKINDEKIVERLLQEDSSASDKERDVEEVASTMIDAVGSGSLKQDDEEASVVKKRRRNEVALVGKSVVQENEGIPAERVDEMRDEGIRRFDVRVDAEGVEESKAVVREQVESGGTVEESSDAFGIEVSGVREVKWSKEEIPGSSRKSGEIESDNVNGRNEAEVDTNVSSNSKEREGPLANREYRTLGESQGKSRHKSSTVYLNAEEKKIPDGEQQSIVEGQIKKLISIRDDALDAQKADKTDGAKFFSSKREVGMDEVAFTREEVLDEENKKKVMTVELIGDKQSAGGDSLLKRWKDQATSLQTRIRDRNFSFRLKEQALEVLPEVPRFTEDQLLDALEQIVSSKRLEPLNESYASNVKSLALTDVQLRIIECAEQLTDAIDRRSFVDSLVECFQGLSVLNCMRIFIWPLVVDNLPESISQNFGSIPIQINLFDLFQANRPKFARAQDLHRVRLITPDSVVYNILQDALETYPNDETLSYIDPKNETLRKLLTSTQLSILQMGEKLLPEAVRKEYSDNVLSCVRKFEYFSCVKYFAWPLVKQYFPALPAFPDYQSWYPIIDLTPQYPVLSFPSFLEDIGGSPDIVDEYANGARKPRPETVIIQVLQNTLKEQPRTSASPSFLDQSTDTYIALMPHDQLQSINMAEQLIPISYRPEFVQKTVRCMKEYNYLTCIKYSAWPTVRHFIPTLPDISSLLPDFQIPRVADIGGYVPEIPAYSDVSFYWPIDGASVRKPINAPTYFAPKNREGALQSSDELETTIVQILSKVRNSIDQSSGTQPPILTGNAITFATFTKRQTDILRLAECLVPSSARASLITEVLTYLQRNNDFIDCARQVIWPSILRHVASLPEFPGSDRAREPIDSTNVQGLSENKGTTTSSRDTAQERIIPGVEKGKITTSVSYQAEQSRNRAPNGPLISVSGTRFVPIFTEHPEAVILNILRSVQLQSFKANVGATSGTIKSQAFLDLLNDQQVNIVNMVDNLLPENARPDFANKLIECLRVQNFLICTREVVWPALSQYFPWLPSFPNIGVSSSNSTSSSSNQNLTEPTTSPDTPPLSQTDVQTGQHGDTTVIVTDTRFLPIYNELPETIILNILKAVQLSIPSLLGPPAPMRTQELPKALTEQQINIVQIAENLLPVASRPEFIDRIGSCANEKNFLECARDIIWPTIAQSYPWLPSFPNFGTIQSTPQASGSGSIRFQVFLSQEPSTSDAKAQASRNDFNEKSAELILKEIEDRAENVLLNALEKSNTQLERSYLNDSNFVSSHLSKQEISIVRLIERGIPDSDRATYVARILECTRRYNFVACTNNVSWPTLKQFIPSLPDFISISDLIPQLPGIVQIPEAGQATDVPVSGSVSSDVPGIPQIPTISQLPNAIASPSKIPGLDGLFGTETQEKKVNGTSATTPSVGNEGVVPSYAGQPPGILIDVSNEKIDLPDKNERETDDSKESTSNSRKRRSATDASNSHYDTKEAFDGSATSPLIVPNITESEYLQLLVKVKENTEIIGKDSLEPKRYFVDTLNSTIRSSLTADQYEILKIVDDLDRQTSNKGVASQVVQCITSLISFSFIRCLGIFAWPLITNALPSLGGGLPSFPSLPSLPSIPSIPGVGIFGRSLNMERQVEEMFDMSSNDFERKLLVRKESIENFLLDWYRKLVEDEFQVNVGFLKIKGYGNSEVGVSFSGFREGRAAKLKDNKNLPSILTIISDIMEEVLDQRPEGEKAKKEKDKRERSMDDARESDIQFLKDNEEYVDVKRSMNDDEIIAMFLNKIKSNDSDTSNDNVQYFDLDDAYKAFGVLFGTNLHNKLPHEMDQRFRSSNGNDPDESPKQLDIVPLESQNGSDELKVLPVGQVTYDFEKESSDDHEERRRRKRAKNLFKSFLLKYSNKRSKDSDKFRDVDENQIVGERYDKAAKSGLMVRLPCLDDDILPKKLTNSMTHLARDLNSKMPQMLPGVGLVMSFLIQMALAHARTAASVASVISNVALGSAMFGMIRDSFFGSNDNPKIKYVYDNDKVGSGISWPTHQGY